MSKPKFVYASSSSVYGDAEVYPTTEDMTPKSLSLWSTKLLAKILDWSIVTEFVRGKIFAFVYMLYCNKLLKN